MSRSLPLLSATVALSRGRQGLSDLISIVPRGRIRSSGTYPGVPHRAQSRADEADRRHHPSYALDLLVDTLRQVTLLQRRLGSPTYGRKHVNDVMPPHVDGARETPGAGIQSI